VIRVRLSILILAGGLAGACAPHRLTLPTDAGAPLPDAAAVHAEVSRACRGVRTLTAELALSGRAGDARLRGRVLAGFTSEGAMRLEGLAPFGAPMFVLAARPGTATLWLPRDRKVVAHEQAADILGALTGVPLAPPDLLAVLTGCVTPSPAVAGGTLHDRGWASIDLGAGSTIYLQRAGQGWEVRAARRTGWEIEYAMWQSGLPRAVRLRSIDGATAVDASVQVSQIETNMDLPASAFEVEVPAGVESLTVEDLRRTGPLREP
jgi:hypothetical protein